MAPGLWPASSRPYLLGAMPDPADNAARAYPSEYPATLEANTVPQCMALELAINIIAPGASHKAVASKLLEARASWHTVRAWRRGTRSIPQWALDLLRAKLEAQVRPNLEARAMLERAAPIIKDRGAYGTRALRAWRLKQKAGK